MKIVIAGPRTAWALPRDGHQVGALAGLAVAAVSGQGGALRAARWLTGHDSQPDVASDMIRAERTN